MKWARIQFRLEMQERPNWLSDSGTYQLTGTEPRGSEVFVVKRGGPTFEIRLVPWWGPPIEFANLVVKDLSSTFRETTDLAIVWSSPTYTVYFDSERFASAVDKRLAAAAEIALPFEVYKKVEGTAMERLLRRPPEMCDAWELTEFPRHITTEFGIQEGLSEFAFLHTASNLTQKAREQVYAWEYANCIDKIYQQANDGQFRHVALLVPKEDRGIDCYLRLLVMGSTPKLAAIPLQICQVPFSPGGMVDDRLPVGWKTRKLSPDEIGEDPEQLILSIVRKAKQKAGPNGLETLLCVLTPTSPAPVNVMKLRDVFENNGPWPYSKIVCLHTSHDLTIAFTANCSPPHRHFIIERREDTVNTFVGRTKLEIDSASHGEGTIVF